MNTKLVNALLACSMMFCAVSAENISNKTYYSSRTEMHQRGREWAQKTHHACGEREKTRYQGRFSVSPFYSRSTNDGSMGEYFGGSNTASGIDAGAVEVIADTAKKSNALFGLDIEHVYNAGTGGYPMAGTMKLRPRQNRLGAMLSYEQSLSQFPVGGLNQLSVSIDVPVVRVENNMNEILENPVASTATSPAITGGVLEYFKGEVTKPAGKNEQVALDFARLPGKELAITRVGDVRISLGYDAVSEKDLGVHFSGGLVLPFGNQSTGVNMFEAVVGNNNHVEAFVGVDGYLDAWAGKTWSIRLSGSAEYTHSFRAREKRTVGVWDTTTQLVAPWAHARLGVKKGAKGTFPLANVLTGDVYVTPGAHFETVIGASLLWKSFEFNVGYNTYLRQKERVALINNWANDTYAIAAHTYPADTASDFKDDEYNTATPPVKTYTSVVVGGPIQQAGKTDSGISNVASARHYLSAIPCTTPDQETHTFLIGANYNHKIKNFPVGIAVGASYELPADNGKSFQGWSVNGSVRIGF